MKIMVAILGLVFMSLTTFATPRTASLLETQIQLVNDGIATGQITNETKAFFLQSIKEMQNGPVPVGEGAVDKFTRLVNEGIASGQITEATKDFFLQAVADLNKNK